MASSLGLLDGGMPQADGVAVPVPATAATAALPPGVRRSILRDMHAGAALLLGKWRGNWETLAGLAAAVAGSHVVSMLESMASRPRP